MLQQTQVERVIPKYRQFLERFPSFAALAAASRAEVIQCWVPLGYNRRAVRLHELARAVVQRGGLPEEPAELERLEGLGAYTAAAVACFAFGRQVPAVDTNVRRVLSRIISGGGDDAQPSARQCAELARDVLPVGRAEDWNQALMDLGATICTARAPACRRCPVADLCAARPGLAEGEGRGASAKRAAEAKAPYAAAERFEGSSRYYRGQIVRRLGALEAGGLMDVDALGCAIRADYSPVERPWLLNMLRALQSDGLARLHGGEELGGEELLVGLPVEPLRQPAAPSRSRY
jgi:A/G-specific adenine glycosylase